MSIVPSKRQRKVARTARSAVRAYGAVKCTQGKLSARRRRRGAHGRAPLLLAAGGGAAIGFLAHPQVWREAGSRAKSLVHRDAAAEDLATPESISEDQITPNGAPVPGGW